jgi:hypothetical protein
MLALMVAGKSCTNDTWAAAGESKNEKTIAAFNGLKLQDGLLTAHVTATPLQRVLSEVSRLSGAKVVWLGQHDNRQVSVDFKDVPVTEALQRLLGPNNFFLFYASAADKARLKEIWGTPQHSSTSPAVPAPPTPTSTAEDSTPGEIDAEMEKLLESHLDTALHGTDRDSRIEAIGFLSGLVEQDPRIRPVLQQLSAGESDPQVRTAASDVLAGSGQ